MADFTFEFNEQTNEFNFVFGQAYVVETGDYEKLSNKPSIEGVTLLGDKTFKQLGMDNATEAEVEAILYLP